MKRSLRQVAVILSQDVEGVGFSGELIHVRPGFARNLLLPKQLAEIATPKLKAEREKAIAAAEARRAKEVAARQAVAEQLAAAPLKLRLKVGPDGQVFGSVTATEVAKAVAAAHQGTEITAKQFSGLPLRNLGSQTVSVKLGLGVVAELPIQISGEPTKAPAKTTKTKPKTTA